MKKIKIDVPKAMEAYKETLLSSGVKLISATKNFVSWKTKVNLGMVQLYNLSYYKTFELGPFEVVRKISVKKLKDKDIVIVINSKIYDQEFTEFVGKKYNKNAHAIYAQEFIELQENYQEELLIKLGLAYAVAKNQKEFSLWSSDYPNEIDNFIQYHYNHKITTI